MTNEIWVIERRPIRDGWPEYLAVKGASPSICLQYPGNTFVWYRTFNIDNVIKFYNRESAAMCLSAIMTLVDRNYAYRDRPKGLCFGDTMPVIVSHGYIGEEAGHGQKPGE